MTKPDYLKKSIHAIENQIIQHRRQFHSNPELSFREFQTAEYIRSYLDKIGIKYSKVLETGTVAVIGSGNRCVALRADIDALAVQETTGLEFSSENAGVMHACGHDMHIAMLLGTAEYLKENEDKLNGVVKLIFQPGEEKLPGGAIQIIESGILKEGIEPEAIFGQHVFPEAPVGELHLASGPFMASTDELYWTVKGSSGHAAQPHLSRDPLLAAANIVTGLQSLISKFRNPLTPGVLSVTAFNSGFTTNIIPDKAELKGTLRSYDEDWRKQAQKFIEENSGKIASLYDTECELNIVNGYPSLINDKSLTDFVKTSAAEIFGSENVIETEPKMWAEDFAYYSRYKPSVFWFLGVRPNSMATMPPLHNSGFCPDESALALGAAMMANTAFKYLNR